MPKKTINNGDVAATVLECLMALTKYCLQMLGDIEYSITIRDFATRNIDLPGNGISPP